MTMSSENRIDETARHQPGYRSKQFQPFSRLNGQEKVLILDRVIFCCADRSGERRDDERTITNKSSTIPIVMIHCT